jgi:hypothetical protein
MLDYKKALMEIKTLVIFRDIREDFVIKSLEEFFRLAMNQENLEEAYAVFLHHLYQKGGDFGKHLLNIVLNSNNFYVRQRGPKTQPEINRCLAWELAVFQSWSQWNPHWFLEVIRPGKKPGEFLPSFENTAYDFNGEFTKRIEELETKGYGIFSQYTMFQLGESGLRPIGNPDLQTLSSLVGYEREKKILVANTKSFLTGKPASNALLYGDAGTGKSSTVKALVNEFQNQGLRLVELKKRQLNNLPGLMEELSENPLKFILLIDDLTFSQADENFAALKSLLEGSASVQSKNVLIYATSNRLHLVRETMEERQGTEIHENDSIQETMGLANRFGLTVTYHRPDRETYLDIVSYYAKEYDLNMEIKERSARAETYALRNGGRSPRAAKQFVQLEKGLS